MSGDQPPAGTPLRGAKPRENQLRFELRVNASTHPFLEGHRIKGAVVVPAVMVLEWLCRAAEASHPGLLLASCRDLRVLRGIVVDDFEGAGLKLAVQTTTLSTGAGSAEVEARLFDASEKPRYSCQISLAALPPVADPALTLSEGGAWPWSLEAAYTDILFHRGPFAVLRSLANVTDSGGSAGAVGLLAAGWQDGAWTTDVALLDGAVQAAALWGTTLLGRLPLPTCIGSFRLHKRGPLEPDSGEVRCIVHGKRMGQHRVMADVDCVQAGSVVCALRNLDFHLPPEATRRD